MTNKSGSEIAIRLTAPILGLVLIVTAMAVAFFQQDFSGWRLGLGITGIVLFFTVFFTWERGNFLNFLQLGLYSLFIAGSLVLVYMIVAKHPHQWDLTRDRVHSLTGQTRSYVRSLHQPVRIVAFVDTEQKNSTEDLLKLYRKENPAQLSYEVIDPTRDPLRARQFDENIYPGDFYVVRGDGVSEKAETKRKKVSLGRAASNAESQLTNAMIEIMRDQTMRIYFLTGHGERPLSQPDNLRPDSPNDSLSEIRRILQERAYPCEPLNVLERGTIPEDCAVLVLAGPRRDLFDIEREMIEDYLRNGGKALFLFDPLLERNARMPNLIALLSGFGVDTPPNSVVADLVSAQLPIGPLSPIVQEFGNHPITQGMPQGAFYLNETRAFTRIEPLPAGVTVTELLKTGRTAWAADVDELLARGGRLRPPDSGGTQQILAMAATRNDPGASGTTRLVVVGDSDVFTDAAINNTTALFFLQACNWLAEQKDLLSIPPKVLSETPIHLTGAQLVFVSFALGLVVLLVLFGGLGFTVLRRKLG